MTAIFADSKTVGGMVSYRIVAMNLERFDINDEPV